jgi:cytochrome c-type biogenesis protein CcmH
VVEARLVTISDELRCLVCQNESLSGSRADLALDLRRELRELIRQGQSDEQIKAFMVARYGDFILYRPPVKSTTWLLWAGPFVMLLLGLLVLLRVIRRAPGAPAPLSAEDRARAQALLESRHD